jgi:serine protease DegQ
MRLERSVMAKTMQQLSEALVAAVKAAAPSLVRVEARRRYPLSGTVWSSDIVVTTSRAIEREEGIRLGLDGGETVSASLVGRDPGTDLAVLRAEGASFQAPSWQDEDLQVGSLVLVLGRPGTSVRASLGMVSAVGEAWRTGAGSRIDRFIEVDARPFPGFSGGPLVSASGAILGINSAALLRGMPVTIPTTTVRRVVEAILEHGRVRRGYLGIGVQPVRLPESIKAELGQETGLLVVSVQPGAAAEAAGLHLGDVLVTLAGEAMRHVDDLQAQLADDRVGETVSARVLRGGELKDIDLHVGEAS